MALSYRVKPIGRKRLLAAGLASWPEGMAPPDRWDQANWDLTIEEKAELWQDSQRRELNMLEWAEARGLRYTKEARCPTWFVNNGHRYQHCSWCLSGNLPSWAQNISGWTLNRKPTVLVLQPPKDSHSESLLGLSTYSIDRIQATCAELGLTSKIHLDGWYERNTVCIELWKDTP